MNVEWLSRGEKKELLTLLEERAIKVPAANSKAIPIIAEDEVEARPLAGKPDAYDAALTALRGHAPLVRVGCSPATLMSWRRTRRADAASLPRFLEGETLPRYAMRWTELGNGPLPGRSARRPT